MPRLGSNNDRGSSPMRPRNPAQAYARRVLPKFNLRNTLIFLVALFILRNILRNDYRDDSMQYLKGSGMNDSEIEKFIPKTLEERRRYVLDKANDLDNMKKDIAYLLSEVSQIREVVSDSMKGVRDTALFEMDHVHKEKRKHKEEELLKENPDFKASSRIPPENRKIRPDSDVEMNA